MKRLFVGNLSYRITEQELQDWFSQAGFQLDTVSIMRDRFSGESRGFGFVEIADDAEAERAVTQLNGQDYQGRGVVINEARPMTDRPSGGSRGGERPRRDRY